MHLPYQEIVRIGKKLIQPFDLELVNPGSYDITLGDEVIYRDETIKLPFDLEPGGFVLATSRQKWNFPCDVGGQLMLKSTTGRNGIDHMLAGWFDPDFCGDATLEFVNNNYKPYTLMPGARIAQMVFPIMLSPVDKPYRLNGRYQGQSGVTPPRPKVDGDNILDDRSLWIAGPWQFDPHPYASWIKTMKERHGLRVDTRFSNLDKTLLTAAMRGLF